MCPGLELSPGTDDIRYSTGDRRPDFRFVRDKRHSAMRGVLAAPAAGSKRELCRISVNAEAEQRQIGRLDAPGSDETQERSAGPRGRTRA